MLGRKVRISPPEKYNLNYYHLLQQIKGSAQQLGGSPKTSTAMFPPQREELVAKPEENSTISLFL